MKGVEGLCILWSDCGCVRAWGGREREDCVVCEKTLRNDGQRRRRFDCEGRREKRRSGWVRTAIVLYRLRLAVRVRAMSRKSE